MAYYLNKQQLDYIEVLSLTSSTKLFFGFFHKCKNLGSLKKKTTYLLKSIIAGIRDRVRWNLNYMYYIFGAIIFFKSFITSLRSQVIFIIWIIKGYIS